MEDSNWIPPETWQTIVENVPIVSVDLVVHRGAQVLLGKRQNEPAKGEWFFSGGRVRKREQREEAVHRIARAELNTDVIIEETLGTDEHIYETAEVDSPSGKHYLSSGYLVHPQNDVSVGDDQHDSIKWFPTCDLPELHPYVKHYLEQANID